MCDGGHGSNVFAIITHMKIIASTILTFLLGAMFVSLFHMSSGMDMSGGMGNCPFMSHEEVLCPMNLADHLGAWESAFLATVPTVVFLLAAVGAIAMVPTLAPYFLISEYKPIPILQRQLRERTYPFSYRSLQELFSNGILHPKLF